LSVAAGLPGEAQSAPDFARLAVAWPALPEPIRRAILALLDAAGR
jgi:hypothetical protein